MRHALVLLAATILFSAQALADGARVSGSFARDGMPYTLTHGVAWQSARPDALVLVLTDAEVPLMAVRHASELQFMAEAGTLRGLRFEFDPARLDLRWVSGRYMTPGWSTYRGGMGTKWDRLEISGGKLSGKLDAGGVKVEFEVPITGALETTELVSTAAQNSPQADALIGYENGMRKGNWKESAKYLTPMSAQALEREVSTPHGLAAFKTAGKYMKDLLPGDGARRQQILKVVVSGPEAAVLGADFAADLVLIDGKWRKI